MFRDDRRAETLASSSTSAFGGCGGVVVELAPDFASAEPGRWAAVVSHCWISAFSSLV